MESVVEPIPTKNDEDKSEKDVEKAGQYLLDMLSSLAQFAHQADLPNTSVLISTVSEVVRKEVRMLQKENSKAAGAQSSVNESE